MAWWQRSRGRSDVEPTGHGDETPSPVDPPSISEWPSPREPARFEGAHILGRAETGSGGTPVGTVQVWAGHARVGLLWQNPAPLAVPARASDAYAAVGALDLVVRVTPQWNPRGPTLSVERRHGAASIVAWEDLSTALGVAMPWWPWTLQRPELVLAWRPGANTVTATAAPTLDVEPLRRAAAGYEVEHPTHQTLMALALECEHQGEISARHDVDDLMGQFGVPEHAVVVAARPASTVELEYEDIDEPTRRVGWLALLERSDPIADACIEQAMFRDGGRDFSASYLAQLDRPLSAAAREWVARLEDAPMTSGHRRLRPEADDAVAMVDPATDAPVLCTGDGCYRLALPQRLPTASPLREIVLEEAVVWVRVEDGTLFPAPSAASYGLAWGYDGGGPGALALLVDRLLADITAHGAERPSGAPRALEVLFERRWPDGTVLTRDQLEDARDS